MDKHIHRERSEKQNIKRLLPGVSVTAVLLIVTCLLAAGIFSCLYLKNKNQSESNEWIASASIENGEVLDLTWRLKANYRKNDNIYSYNILLYDVEQKPKVELKVSPPQNQSASVDFSETQIWSCEAVIYDYRDGTVETKKEILDFMGYIDRGDNLHLALDAVDCRLEDTSLSAVRFWQLAGLNLRDLIYVKIAAVDENGNLSRWMETNQVHMLMDNSSDCMTQIYKISNARHLFNVRFMEQINNETEPVVYEQIANISWSGERGIVSSGHVYFGASVADCFLPIECLGENATLMAKNYVLSSFSICADPKDNLLGLIGVNYGTILGLTIENATVSEPGDKNPKAAGTVCAINYGIILDTRVRTSSVKGMNYTGGLVGCVMPGAHISNCDFKNGTVSGDYFVGGLVGVNHSDRLLNGDVLSVSPDVIRGSYFVGGLIGANIVLTENKAQNLQLNVHVSSENGQIICDGMFAGGVVGYNILFAQFNFKEDGSLPCDDVIAWIRETVMHEKSDVCSKVVELLNEKMGYGSEFGRLADVDTKMVLSTDKEILDGYGNLLLKNIEGQACVGGVLGYQDVHSGLEISNIRSYVDVYANSTIKADGKLFAYAGGITGIVNENTIINNCALANDTLVLHHGDYQGSIAEINNGWLIQCEAPGNSDETADHIGGIAGLNTARAYIKECRLTGTLTGNNNVGGIAAVNDGTILACVIDGDVNGYGAYIGGAAGTNRGIIKNVQANKSVNGVYSEEMSLSPAHRDKGSYVGGIAGYNAGTVTDCAVESGGISGNSYVGGYVGYNSRGNLTELINATEVHGQQYVGGIAGFSDVYSMITKCENNAVVYCRSGYVGGITSFNGENSVIKQCSVGARVDAPNAYCVGGLCGINVGTLDQCIVSGSFKLTNAHYLGGISAINYGNIVMCFVEQLDIALQGGMADSSVGGIAGVNMGMITTSGSPAVASADTVKTVNITSNVKGSYIGGVAGYNHGIINGILPAQVKTIMIADVSAKNKAAAYAGGITGKNTGSVTGYVFDGSVESAGDTSYGVGGIAGVNGNDGNDTIKYEMLSIKDKVGFESNLHASSKARIVQCEVSDYRINSTTLTDGSAGDSSKYTVYAYGETCARTGGIVGFNCINGIIEQSVPVLAYVRSDCGYTGGVTGLNYGQISACRAVDLPLSKETKINVKLYVTEGNIGGIAGVNAVAGSITDCMTGMDWLVLSESQNKKESRDSINTAGGIIGTTKSLGDISDVHNYAVVKLNGNDDYGYSGGIAGYIENLPAGSEIKIENCSNNNDIIGTSTGGALIGAIGDNGKDALIMILSCENNGEVYLRDKVSDRLFGGLFGHGADIYIR